MGLYPRQEATRTFHAVCPHMLCRQLKTSRESQAGEIKIRHACPFRDNVTRLLQVANHHAIPDGNEGDDPVVIRGDGPGKLADALRGRRAVSAIEDPSTP